MNNDRETKIEEIVRMMRHMDIRALRRVYFFLLGMIRRKGERDMKSDTATIEREKTIKEIVGMLANTDEEALRFIRSFLRAAREQHKRDNKRV